MKTDFEPHYVITSAGRILVRFPDCKAGWAYCDGDHYWPKGDPAIAEDKTFMPLLPNDSRITKEHHAKMDTCIPGLGVEFINDDKRSAP